MTIEIASVNEKRSLIPRESRYRDEREITCTSVLNFTTFHVKTKGELMQSTCTMKQLQIFQLLNNKNKTFCI